MATEGQSDLEQILDLFRVIYPENALPPEVKALQMLHKVKISGTVNIPNYPFRPFLYIVNQIRFKRFCDNIDANNKKQPVNRINMEAAWCQLLVGRCIKELSRPTARIKMILDKLIEALCQMRKNVENYWTNKGKLYPDMEIRHYPLDLDSPALSCDFRLDQDRRFIKMLYPGEDGYLSDLAVIRGYEEHEAENSGQGGDGVEGVTEEDIEICDAPAVEESPQFSHLAFRPASAM